MTPREIERTLEFIVEQQAQAAVHMHQARVDLQQAAVHIQRLAERQGKMESMFELMTELAQVQSQRLDRHDETFKAVQVWQREELSRLDQILERLTRDR